MLNINIHNKSIKMKKMQANVYYNLKMKSFLSLKLVQKILKEMLLHSPSYRKQVARIEDFLRFF